MRPTWKSLELLRATPVALVLLILTLGDRPVAGDEPSRLGRLFRFGGLGSSSTTGTSSPPAPTPGPSSPATPTTPGPTTEISPSSVPGAPAATPSPRIVPRPRVSRPVTESDPILTRITLNRSDDGNQFGMFLQVFADGTILDGEGVHHVSQDDLKPLIEALQAGDVYRLKGHCGGPATDFIESVHVTVFERSLGRLRASSFSYSGNPQGCDSAVRHLHATLDSLQAKIMRPPAAPSPSPEATPGNGNSNAISPLPAPAPPAVNTPPGGSQTVIPLTPDN